MFDPMTMAYKDELDDENSSSGSGSRMMTGSRGGVVSKSVKSNEDDEEKKKEQMKNKNAQLDEIIMSWNYYELWVDQKQKKIKIVEKSDEKVYW